MRTSKLAGAPYDAVIVGAGIMGATMAALLAELEPTWKLAVIERLREPGLESSGAWHNAGTGHSALCELNYTPQAQDGSVSIAKAVEVHSQFQESLQAWASWVAAGKLSNAFINSIPHMSFVTGDDRAFLKERHARLTQHPFFASLQYTEDAGELATWAPLLGAGRGDQPFAATRSLAGADLDFGSLTRGLLASVNADVFYDSDVKALRRRRSGKWSVTFEHNGEKRRAVTPFVFVGAGGGTLPLLQKARLKEARGFGGFPISGKFWHTHEPRVVAMHEAKTYGQASVGAPPMSVPHLDTRVIGPEKSLLFGPYAGFSPRFLKEGSLLDLFKSLRWHNLLPMLSVGVANMPLTWYLVKQVVASSTSKFSELQRFYPEARESDWEEVVAGQRVQVIKPTGRFSGSLQFGTEVIVGAEGTMAGLLGASPGASTAVSIMLETLARAFPAKQAEWASTLDALVPSRSIPVEDAEAYMAPTAEARRILGLVP